MPTSSVRKLCYFFHPKHHNPKDTSESQWLPPPDLTPQEEFDIFDAADKNELADSDGNLYGVRVVGNRLGILGTQGQQVARFWKETASHPWHGHPICPILSREKRLHRPVPRDALDKMKKSGLIKPNQYRRLTKGK